MSRLGIDIGGTKVAVRVEGDARAAYQTAFRWPAAGDARRDLGELRECLVRVQAEWGEPIVAAGVAMPASLDPNGRVVTWPSRPGWDGLDFPGALRDTLPHARVRVADDGDLAALAEARAVGATDVIYLGIGTGVGGGVVLAGEPVPGTRRGSAEIGHMVIDRTGPVCTCGRRGCVQAYASGPATLRRASEYRGGEVSYEELQGNLDEPWAVRALDEACEAVAIAVVSLSEVLRPSVAIIGGGFAAGLPGFAHRVATKAAAWNRPGHPAPPIEPALLGGLSSLHGAVLLAAL
ncbi:ROK family protein [Hamadaea tsunoensis]|uniref:ROK family protein n=1 Tax=Hamadaea tsunoensis TaxID=53368 RepID=UPI00041CEABB|nr:ROK family protein [Hamadaea tsunoensis]